MYKLTIDNALKTKISEHDEFASIAVGEAVKGSVLLSANEEYVDLKTVLASSEVVIIRIDNFADGRFFSLARIIREQQKYTGEISAYGNFIADQIEHMHRLGFTSFLFDTRADAELAESVVGLQLNRINYQSLYLEESHVYND